MASLLLCCSTFDDDQACFTLRWGFLKLVIKILKNCHQVSGLGLITKSHQTLKTTYADSFKSQPVFPIFMIHLHLGLNQVKWSCPAGTTCWMFTLKQNISVLSLSTASLPCWMMVVPLCLPVAAQSTVAPANGGIPWLRVWTGSSVSSHHFATAAANIAPFHKVLHVCGTLWLVNKRRGGVIWCQLPISPASEHQATHY